MIKMIIRILEIMEIDFNDMFCVISIDIKVLGILEF